MDFGWKQSFRLQHDEVIGLDIGSSEVKMVQLNKYKGGYAVTAVGAVEIAANKDSVVISLPAV